MGTGLRRPRSIVAASLFAAGWTLAQGFCFVPALKSGVGVGCGNERRPTSRCQCQTAAGRDVAERGLTMRGLSKKGKNGPGLTGVQRVLNTRERVRESSDPCKVMISNLDYTLTEEDVKLFCSSAGPVTAVKLIRKRYAKTSKGYGFVDFDQPLTATIAIEDLNGAEFHGRVVELKPAVTTREKLIRENNIEWEKRQALERERRAALGYTDEVEEDDEQEELAPKVATQQTSEGSVPSYAAFRELISPRVKKKPRGFQ